MSDAAPPNDVRRLIAAALEPPASGPSGALRRLVRRTVLRASRPRALHQQAIDRGLLAEIQRLDEWRANIDALASQLREDQLAAASGHHELRDWLANLQREQGELEEELVRTAQLAPAAAPLHGNGAIALETFDAGLGGTVVGFRREAGEDVDQRVYVGFEDYFRGSEQTIRDRQRAYLPLLEGRGPILDVGCGRGELLELMAERGVEARGIDLDPGMVEHCLSKGLSVELADAVSFLERQAPGSFDVVVALQVIEHLPYSELVSFLRTTRQKLGPGGRVLMETVNPHSPQALKHFWIDPTHQHPLFPEIIVALCALTGFALAYIWYPQGSGDPDRDRLAQLDYAVIAETVAR